MMVSMTGYGRAENTFRGLRINVEIKSLNSRNLDLNVHLPRRYSDKEMLLRKRAAKHIVRGKAFLGVKVNAEQGASILPSINLDAIRHYLKEFELVEKETGLNLEQLTKELVKLPDVFLNETLPEDDEWDAIERTIEEAFASFVNYRKEEGISLQDDIHSNLLSILELLDEIIKYETLRVESIRTRILNTASSLSADLKLDANRLEQEMIFYLEKLDINEEKIRLKHHCEYFQESMHSDDSNGKKLGFICQEIGREINTIGSKANQKDIQKIVVQMKEHQEKIKEQLLNVL